MRPTLAPEDVAREKELALAGIRARSENANRVAQTVGRTALFGRGRPARPPRRRLRGHGGKAGAATRSSGGRRACSRPARATLVFAGDFTPEQIKAALDKALGGWKGGEAPRPPRRWPPSSRRSRASCWSTAPARRRR